jgi:endonuclease YncB( thermonuclease family)
MRRKVKKVLDGDTFQTHRKVNGSNIVRLANYNAPEKNQHGGKRATNRLRGLIGGKSVTIDPRGKSYGRTVADVFLGRRKINDVMRIGVHKNRRR